MPHVHAAALIARSLPTGLPHPGNPQTKAPPTLVTMPGFRPVGMTKEHTTAINAAAQLIGEAIINLLELSGYAIVDAKQPKPVLDVGDYKPTVITCRHCNQLVISFDPTHQVDPRAFIKLAADINPDCPHA